jgi:hypothetical protein
MLGSFYEKAWDLDRSANEDSHSLLASLPQDKPRLIERKRRRSSHISAMHLPNGDHSVRFGNVANMFGEKQTYSNGISTPRHDGEDTSCSTTSKSQPSKSNEVRMTVPHDLASEEVLDTILTAWAILIQRYQRDTFHQFTWGINKGSGNERIQCIGTPELDLPNQKAAQSLQTKISSLRLRDIPVTEGSEIFLNDGTKLEASSIVICFMKSLT